MAVVMGVVNPTPDSFSGDGLPDDFSAAVLRGVEMAADGAAIVDVGGESTRPGYVAVSESEELRRAMPIVEALSRRGIEVSIDTRKPAVAERAVLAGASMVNDVSGVVSPAMARVVARTDVRWILMHNAHVDDGDDAATSVGAALSQMADLAQELGVSRERLLVDPGLGFGKTWRINLRLIRDIHRIVDLGFPVVVGPSRKGTIARVLGGRPDDRLEGSLALAALCISGGASIVRMHDVRAAARTLRMTEELLGPRG